MKRAEQDTGGLPDKDDAHGEEKPALARHWPAIAVFLFGCGLTIYVWSGFRSLIEQRAEERFVTDVRKLVEQIEGRMQVYAALLAAGAGLHEASESVSAAEWKKYAGMLQLQERYPGVQGYGFSEFVPPGRQREFEAAQQRVHGDGFRIRPDGPRDQVHAIIHLEPQDERNRRALGYDMYSEPVRRAAMERAQATGTVQMSAPVRLVQEIAGTREQPGVLMFHPVYQNSTVAGGERKERAHLKGFVYAPFRMHDLMDGLLRAQAPDFRFELVDRGGIDGFDQVLYSLEADRQTGGIRGQGVLARERGFAVAGRIWSVRAAAPRGYGNRESGWQEVALLGAGIALSLLLAVIVHMLMRTRDRAVTLASQMTTKLETSRRRFERIVAGTTDGAWEHDAISQKSFLSPRFREILGFEPAEAVVDGMWVVERVHPKDRRAIVKAFAAMQFDGHVFDQRMRMRMADESFRWFRVRGRMFKDGHGAMAAGSMSDVNDEQEASFREERLIRVVEMSPDLFMTFDLEGRATYLNAAARRIFGEVTSDSLAGFSISGIFSQSEVDRVFNEGVPTAYMQDHWEGETELITAAGEVLPVSQVILSHKNNAGQVEFYSTVMRDISERRSSMQALTEAQERLQRALDGSTDGIWERQVENDAFSTSDRLAEILGYAPEEMPRTRTGWRALNHPDDLPTSDAAVARMAQTSESVVWDTRMRMGSGEYRWMRRRGRMVRDRDGNPLLTAGTLTDIHEARLAEIELRRHRDNLAQLVEERTAGLERARLDAEASRESAVRANQAKSEFLANMSHELRTPMHAIISFANFGVDKSDRAERDKLLHYFRNIQKSGSRLLTLLNDLLDLSKLEAGKMDMAMAPVNAAALLADAIAEAEAFAMTRKVRLSLDADPERLGVVWDGPRILQVIRNLISNAVKFSLAEGTVAVSARTVALPAGRRASDPQVPGVEIRVCDAGIGIPEGELETIFDKFVQSSKTKTGAGGTGLGLAICREIILAHQGSIRAENNAAPQAGATFAVLLPVSPSAARQSRDAASIQPHQHLEEMK